MITYDDKNCGASELCHGKPGYGFMDIKNELIPGAERRFP
jgi:hypothetical protein